MAHVSTAELCKLLAGDGNEPLTPPRVTQLVKEGMPKAGPNKFDGIRCMYWYLGRMRRAVKERKSENADGTSSGIEAERKRLLRAQSDLAELEYRRELGELIPIEIVESEWLTVAQNVKQRFLALPTRLAIRLEGLTRPEIKALLSASIKETLELLSRNNGDSK